MFVKKTAVALAFGCALAVSGGVAADPFLFNPNGTGAAGAITVTTIDWAPGNTLALPGNPPGGLTTGDIVQDLYQSNLTALLNNSLSVFANGTGGKFFTVVASFYEEVVDTFVGSSTAFAAFDDSATTATLNLTSYFRICAQTALANDLTGIGFACTDTNAILIGTLTDIVGSSQTINLRNPPQNLDQYTPDGNNWPGQLTLTSVGAADIVVTVIYANPLYFPDLNAGTSLVTALSNTSLVTPFKQVDPSYCFSNTGTTDCNVAALGTLGPINGAPGSGPNFIFQADANTTLTRTVPEPGTLALFGLGLALVSVASRRRKDPQGGNAV